MAPSREGRRPAVAVAGRAANRTTDQVQAASALAIAERNADELRPADASSQDDDDGPREDAYGGADATGAGHAGVAWRWPGAVCIDVYIILVITGSRTRDGRRAI